MPCQPSLVPDRQLMMVPDCMTGKINLDGGKQLTKWYVSATGKCGTGKVLSITSSRHQWEQEHAVYEWRLKGRIEVFYQYLIGLLSRHRTITNHEHVTKILLSSDSTGWTQMTDWFAACKRAFVQIGKSTYQIWWIMDMMWPMELWWENECTDLISIKSGTNQSLD